MQAAVAGYQRLHLYTSIASIRIIFVGKLSRKYNLFHFEVAAQAQCLYLSKRITFTVLQKVLKWLRYFFAAFWSSNE